jgi:DHA1 family bicyclomycin/chloramphenicol resistance-like MFS transporter
MRRPPAHFRLIGFAMDQPRPPAQQQVALTIPRWEFIALCAALMALNALAVDIMLPALQQIGASLGVESENHRQYVLTTYIIGFGLAQLAFGPLSDRFGRRKPLAIGLIIYVVAALAAAAAPSFALLLVFRFVQGVGAAATRVIAVSVVRDRFGGRRMAEVMSLIFMVFMAVPVVAPGLGQFIMLFSTWHFIFAVMGGGAALVTVWMLVRLPETLHPEYRRPFTLRSVAAAFRIVLSNRAALGYTLATMSTFGALFGFINSAQQIYVDVYGMGIWFPFIFAGIAGMMAVSSFMNSRLVGRFGMRRLSHGALSAFIAVSTLRFGWSLTGPVPFTAFVAMFGVAMFLFGLVGSNFNALAMEPLGEVAGTASSVLGFTQTFGGGIIGTIIGQLFNGTVMPLAAGFCGVSIVALLMVLFAERGKLFQPHNPPV